MKDSQGFPLKVGQRVRYNDLKARVVCLAPDGFVGISYERVAYGAHTLDGRLPKNTGYWVYPKELTTEKSDYIKGFIEQKLYGTNIV